MNKNVIVFILLIGIVLMGMASYLYYKQDLNEDIGKQNVFNTTEEKDDVESIASSVIEHQKVVTEEESNTTTEIIKQEVIETTEKKQNAKLPDNYEWDEKRWGEPPQIIYDFAENQEKFDFIVKEIDSLLSEGEGFSTGRNNDKLYSESKNGEQLKNDIHYLLSNTKFYNIIKYKYGHWNMEYDQDEYGERYTYIMIYIPEMTEEEAWDEGYIKVVGNWYFVAEPLV